MTTKQAFFPDDEDFEHRDTTEKEAETDNLHDAVDSLQASYFCARVDDQLYALLRLQPFNRPARNVYFKTEHLPKMPVRMVCLIDVSHSMNEAYGHGLSKIQQVKIFGRLLTAVVSEEDSVGLVTFGTGATTLLPLCKMTEANKKRLLEAFEGIVVGGVTNLSAGLTTAISLFNQTYAKKNRNSNDNILLLTDGMANEGLVECSEVLRDVRKKIQTVRTECLLSEDYTVKISTAGTNGFFPETIYHLGQIFSSGSFHHIGENSDFAIDLLLPFLYMQEVVVTDVNVLVKAQNGVSFSDEELLPIKATSSLSKSNTKIDTEFVFSQAASHQHRLLYQHHLLPNHNPIEVPLSPRSAQVQEVVRDLIARGFRQYHIADLAIDSTRHILLPITLPKKHKKVLKDKEVLSVEFHYQDSKEAHKNLILKVPYSDIPLKKEENNEESELMVTRSLCRIRCVEALDQAATLVAKLDRNEAIKVLEKAVEYTKRHLESMLNSEGCDEEKQHKEISSLFEPLIDNLIMSKTYLDNFSARWDDAWSKLKSLRSSLGQEVFTNPSVYSYNRVIYMTESVSEKMKVMKALLEEIYAEKGICIHVPVPSSPSDSESNSDDDGGGSGEKKTVEKKDENYEKDFKKEIEKLIKVDGDVDQKQQKQLKKNQLLPHQLQQQQHQQDFFQQHFKKNLLSQQEDMLKKMADEKYQIQMGLKKRENTILMNNKMNQQEKEDNIKDGTKLDVEKEENNDDNDDKNDNKMKIDKLGDYLKEKNDDSSPTKSEPYLEFKRQQEEQQRKYHIQHQMQQKEQQKYWNSQNESTFKETTINEVINGNDDVTESDVKPAKIKSKTSKNKKNGGDKSKKTLNNEEGMVTQV